MEIIDFTGTDQRIDKFLATSMNYSRSFIQNLIDKEIITILTPGSTNPEKIKKSYTLSAGDKIYIKSVDKFFDGSLLKETPQRSIDIRDEYDDYAVIYKPAGIISHPNSIRDIQEKSVVGGIYHYFGKENLPSSGSFIRGGLVHRLDKDTSGYMIIAKTQKGLDYFSDLFYQKSQATCIKEKETIPITKIYTATVFATKQGNDFLKHITDTGIPYYIQEPVTPKTPHPITKEGISKILEFKPLDKDKSYYTVQIEILTGRTHQIRVHLSNHGLLIKGDTLYGIESEGPMELYATYLSFTDIYGKQKQYGSLTL